MSIKSYQDLVVWQKARALAKAVYQQTAVFPADERFTLTSQMRRAAIGVISNIAEGYGRGSQQDYLRFLRIARGSLFELEAQSIVAGDLGYLDHAAVASMSQLIEDVARPLSGLIRSLERD